MADRGLLTGTASFDSILQVSEPTTKPPLTKVACTLGPCSRDVALLEKMLEAGMSAARLDFSWGTKVKTVTLEYHTETVDNLLRAIRHTKIPCALMLDTEGTEIHIHNKSREALLIEKGASVVLTCDASVVATQERLPVSIPSFQDIPLLQGTEVFVGQYLFTGSETTSVYLTVVEVMNDQEVLCVANENATLAGMDFIVNFSGVRSPLPILSEKDKDAIRTFGKMFKIHFLTLSLCRDADDVQFCREFLDKIGLKSTKILAKIENTTALKNFAEILSVADGIIFSRGLIGLDIAAEKIFRLQKYVIEACNGACKPVTVTRVMDTMTESPRPTRAEATDIANLVLEGVDCLLLGAETFRGKHPVTTLKVIQDIAKQAEQTFDAEVFRKTSADEVPAHPAEDQSKLDSLAYSAVRSSALIAADLVVVFTVSGRAARVLSKYRPPVPILAVVFPKLVSTGLKWTFSGEAEARHLLISRNCVPMLADPSLGGTAETEAAQMEGSMLNRAIAYAYNKKWIQLGSRIVLSQHAKKNTDWSFEEAGVVKFIVVSEEVLDAAIDTYNIHSKSVQNLKKTMFRPLVRKPTFTDVPVNEMPAVIPTRSPHVFAAIPEQSSGEHSSELNGTGEGGSPEEPLYEVSDVPMTPEDSLLNQQVDAPCLTPQGQRSKRWFSWRRH